MYKVKAAGYFVSGSFCPLYEWQRNDVCLVMSVVKLDVFMGASDEIFTERREKAVIVSGLKGALMEENATSTSLQLHRP